MGIKDHGFVVNARFDDYPLMHAAYLTHDGKNVIFHDYAQLVQISSKDKSAFLEHFKRFSLTQYFTLKLRDQKVENVELITTQKLNNKARDAKAARKEANR